MQRSSDTLYHSIQQLLNALRRSLISSVPSSSKHVQVATTVHLSHIATRIERILGQLKAGNDVEAWTRLQGRLQDLHEELTSSEDGGPEKGRGERNDLIKRSHQILQATTQHLERLSSISTSQHSTSRTRTPSTDLPHRAPSSILPPLSIQARLDQAYTLHLAATQSSLLDAHRPAGPTPPPELEPELPNEPPIATREIVLASLPEGWIDSIRSQLHSSEQSLEAWKSLRSRLWACAAPLIPPRLGGGTTKYHLESLIQHPAPLDKEKDLRPLFDLLIKLCSPARDEQARLLLAALDQEDDLVEIVLDALRLGRQMSLDLEFARSLVRSSIGRETMDRWSIERSAVEKEREVVLSIVEEVVENTKAWIECSLNDDEVGLSEEAFGRALVSSLFSTRAVDLPPLSLHSAPSTSTHDSNRLPYVLLVPAPKLFKLQNKLQAIIIVACLSSLVGLPSPTSRDSTPGSLDDQEDQGKEFVGRLWAHLSSSIVDDTKRSGEEGGGGGGTRLINLSDELIRHHRASTSCSTSSGPWNLSPVEEGFKKGVERILRYEDPVYRLLSKRLKDGIILELAKGKRGGAGLPSQLRTGRTPGTPSDGAGSRSEEKRGARIKGFDYLVEQIEEVRAEIKEVIDWALRVWGQDLGFSSLVKHPA